MLSLNLVSYEFVHHPKLFNHTKLATQGNSVNQSRTTLGRSGAMQTVVSGGPCHQKNLNFSKEWTSSYRGVTADTANRPRNQSQRPLWSINRIGYTSSRGAYNTEFRDTIGVFGHNPKDVLPAESTKQDNIKNELSLRTQKVTAHIPGYSGFIPQTEINAHAVKQSEGEATRQTIIKQNIVENQHVRVPGYQGHKTMSVVNDRGNIRPKCLSTQGESFH